MQTTGFIFHDYKTVASPPFDMSNPDYYNLVSTYLPHIKVVDGETEADKVVTVKLVDELETAALTDAGLLEALRAVQTDAKVIWDD